MRRERKLSKDDRLETFYCTIESVQRSYVRGINWWPTDLDFDNPSERDVTIVMGAVRHPNFRKVTHCEAHLLPAQVSRRKWPSDLEQIGNVWSQRGRKGVLLCSVWMPEPTYYSLVETLERNRFAEMVVRVRNLKYHRGCMDEITFSPVLSALDEDL